jgi:hypothetical protein
LLAYRDLAKRFDGTEEFVVHEAGKRSSHWFATIWNSDFRRKTALIWLAFAANSFVLYIFTNYLRVLLEAAGQTSAIGSKGLSLFSLGAAFGSIGGAFMIGWYGSKWVGTTLAFMGAVATLLIGTILVAGNPSFVHWRCAVAGASVNGMQALSAPSARILSDGDPRLGIEHGPFSRIGAVLNPASYYFAMQPTPPVNNCFLFVAGVMLITVLGLLIPSHIPRNTRWGVEDTSGSAAQC